MMSCKSRETVLYCERHCFTIYSLMQICLTENCKEFEMCRQQLFTDPNCLQILPIISFQQISAPVKAGLQFKQGFANMLHRVSDVFHGLLRPDLHITRHSPALCKSNIVRCDKQVHFRDGACHRRSGSHYTCRLAEQSHLQNITPYFH